MSRKGSAEELERRRLRAATLIERGDLTSEEVAERVGVSLTSVKVWKRSLREGGKEALAAKPHLGPKSKLTDEQKARLAEIVREGAVAAGFANDLWTTRRVREVVLREFGVEYDPDHLGRILHDLGFSPQKPQVRASQRDEEAIERWRTDDWPRIKNGLVAAA